MSEHMRKLAMPVGDDHLTTPNVDLLTPRERDVAQLMAQGHSDRAISSFMISFVPA